MCSLMMIEINLLPQEMRDKISKAGRGSRLKQASYFAYAVFIILLAIHIFLAAALFSKSVQARKLNSEFKKFQLQKEALGKLNKQGYSLFSDDSKAIQQLVAAALNWAQKLNRLSLDLPPGIWFNEITANAEDFTLKGSVISFQKEEMSLINRFMGALEADGDFFKDFSKLELSSVQRKTVGGYEVVDFILIGTIKARSVK